MYIQVTFLFKTAVKSVWMQPYTHQSILKLQSFACDIVD